MVPVFTGNVPNDFNLVGFLFGELVGSKSAFALKTYQHAKR